MSLMLTDHEIREITFNFHALHYDCLQPKLGLDSVFAVIVPPGGQIGDDQLQNLFQIGGFDPIASTPSSEPLTRIAGVNIDLFMFGFSGNPADLVAWMSPPDLAIGVVLSNMISVNLVGEEHADVEQTGSQAMITSTITADSIFGIVRIDDESFAEISQDHYTALFGLATPIQNIPS